MFNRGFLGQRRRKEPRAEINMACTNLPAETWELIFAQACTDGGATGRALSLVSRYFRATSFNYKHRSIALLGPAQIIAFSTMLRCAETPKALRRVQNLFIQVRPKGQRKTMPDPHEASRGIPIILSCVAATLVHLSCVVDGARLETIIPTPLPALTDLCVADSWFPHFIPRSKIGPGFTKDALPIHPNLRRIHIRGNGDSAMALARAAPRLTHLRVSGLYWDIPVSLNAPLYILRQGDSDQNLQLHSEVEEDARILRRLERLVLQPELREHPSDRSRTGRQAHLDMMATLDGHERRIGSLFVLDGPEIITDEPGGDLYQSWLQGNVGRFHVWSETWSKV